MAGVTAWQAWQAGARRWARRLCLWCGALASTCSSTPIALPPPCPLPPLAALLCDHGHVGQGVLQQQLQTEIKPRGVGCPVQLAGLSFVRQVGVTGGCERWSQRVQVKTETKGEGEGEGQVEGEEEASLLIGPWGWLIKQAGLPLAPQVCEPIRHPTMRGEETGPCKPWVSTMGVHTCVPSQPTVGWDGGGGVQEGNTHVYPSTVAAPSLLRPMVASH